MTSSEVIDVSNVTKAFYFYKKPIHRLWQIIFGKNYLSRNNFYDELYAVKNVSFKVKKGEAFAILGRNGAGKSTLLQLICGTLQPTQGVVNVFGRIAAQLELGSGINMDLSGRENIFLLGTILGANVNQINDKLDEIVKFSELADSIDHAVSTYSSGMAMRLAFSINLLLDPDVLIIDEALGVGDAPFQAKCFARLSKFKEKGGTLLFVSHDIETVRALCDTAIWMNNGEVYEIGNAVDVCNNYQKYCLNLSGVNFDIKTENQCNQEIHFSESHESEIVKGNCLNYSERHGNKKIEILEVKLLSSENLEKEEFSFDELFKIRIEARSNQNLNDEFVLGIRIKDKLGRYVYNAIVDKSTSKITINSNELIMMEAELSAALTHGDYSILIAIFGSREGFHNSFGNYEFEKAEIWDWIEDSIFFKVKYNKRFPIAGPYHYSLNNKLKIQCNGVVEI
jgi:lipopolysaccharide transport system ATP-binding protein